MSRNKHPIDDAERARVAPDAERLLSHLRRVGKQSTSLSSAVTVVRDRRVLAEEVGITVRQLGRAETHLQQDGSVKTDRLVPRDEREASLSMYRWTVRKETR